MIPRYTRPEMAKIWEPENRFRIWLEIETLALDQEQADADRSALLRELASKYPGVTALPAPQEEGKEPPVYQLGSRFGIYRPVPQVKLGLDLQGGAHVVLRCLPETRLTFSSPPERPMSQKAPAWHFRRSHARMLRTFC